MKVFTIIISAFTTFFIVGSGSLGAVLVALGGQAVNKNALWVCVMTGVVAAMKDIRATMSLPPLSNGNYETLTRLIKSGEATELIAKNKVNGTKGNT